MNIASLLDTETILPHLKVESKDELLDSLINALEPHVENAEELERIRSAVYEREKIMSTGVGKGLAIPHGKAKGLEDNYAVFALLDNAVEYGAIDDQPVDMVFLLVGPESQNSTHIKLLSRISRLMNNAEFRDKLSNCDTAEKVYKTFEEEEQLHFSAQ